MSINILSQRSKNEIGIQTDNDSYLANGSDRYYTNGIFLYYLRALNLPKGSKLANKIIGVEVVQKMYTPQSAVILSPKHIDRPFAGYIYIEPHINLLYKNETSIKLAVQIGTIGKLSLAESTQNLIHRILGLYETKGWQYQIDNQFIFNMSSELSQSFFKKSFFDLTLNSKLDLGNSLIGINTGPILRFGKFNSLSNSKLTQSLTGSSENTLRSSYELYFYYHPKIIFTVYDATVEGNIFSKELNTQQVASMILPFVYSNQLGIDYSSRNITLGISFTFQTKDVMTMIKNYHSWGSFSFSYLF
ncbi:lipid A deacylase LpxR family protein [Chryseobacterium sp. SIMBA_028]